MTRSLVAATISCLAFGGSAEAATPFVYDRELGDVARASLVAASEDRLVSRAEVKRVYVRCYRNKRVFERVFEQRYGISAALVVAYYTGGPDLYLRNGTCDSVRSFLGGRHTVYTAGAYAILLHEALHRQGVRDEHLTSCLANEAVRRGAERFGFAESRALRARNLAFAYTRLFAPPSYRMSTPNCLALTRRSNWIDHVDRDA